MERILDPSEATVLANDEVAAELDGEGAEVTVLKEKTRRVGTFTLQAVPVRHESSLSDALPRTTAFLVNGQVPNLSDPPDSPLLAFAGVEALVPPLMAPFLIELGVVEFARRMRPQHVLPAIFLGHHYRSWAHTRIGTDYAVWKDDLPKTLPIAMSEGSGHNDGDEGMESR